MARLVTSQEKNLVPFVSVAKAVRNIGTGTSLILSSASLRGTLMSERLSSQSLSYEALSLRLAMSRYVSLCRSVMFKPEPLDPHAQRMCEAEAPNAARRGCNYSLSIPSSPAMQVARGDGR